ncbi:MAG: hypothetical protein L0220_34755 [Acidobacteria bacterium]|nr:hypothetical protein [Acidobacteriota bacterium]
MKIKIKDEVRLRRYRKLSPTKRAKVDQIVKRYLKSCAALEVEPEIEVVFREAIDLVVTGRWEPDRPWEKPEARRHYDVYTPPRKDEAA